MKKNQHTDKEVSAKLVSWALFLIAGTIFLMMPEDVKAQSGQWTTSGNNINNTNSGNVGIGTSNPSAKLEISDPTTGTSVKINPGVFQPQFKFTSGNPSSEGYGTTYFSFGYAYSSGITTNTYSNGSSYVTPDVSTSPSWRLLFPNCPASSCSYPSDNFAIGRAAPTSGTPSFSDFFVINSQGNIGLGITAPTTKLHLKSGTDSATTFLHLDTGVHGGSAFTVGGTASNESTFDLSVYRLGSYSSRFGVNSAGSVYLQPGGGNVGVGTTSPAYSLDVNGGANGFRAKTTTVSSDDAVATFENSSGVQVSVRGNGNVGIGTASPSTKLHVVGDVTVTGNIAAKYQDVAEWVESSEIVDAGTVVVLDTTKSNQVIASTRAYDTKVAGVISARPGLTLGEQGEGRVLVATTGRVKLKVDATRAPIRVGDLLVTSDRAGFAMKSKAVKINGVEIHRPGTLIGKALEPLNSGTGEILVLLSLQ